MRFYVALEPDTPAQPVVVDLVALPSGALEATVDGRSVELDATPVGGQLSVLVDGRVVDLTTDGVPPDLGAFARGHRARVRIDNERMRAAARSTKTATAGGDKVIKSPMPGRVVKVLVAEGDVVRMGQGLVVLEAMKMENELHARTAGTVATVHVTAGTAVEGNAKLITLA